MTTIYASHSDATVGDRDPDVDDDLEPARTRSAASSSGDRKSTVKRNGLPARLRSYRRNASATLRASLRALTGLSHRYAWHSVERPRDDNSRTRMNAKMREYRVSCTAYEMNSSGRRPRSWTARRDRLRGWTATPMPPTDTSRRTRGRSSPRSRCRRSSTSASTGSRVC